MKNWLHVSTAYTVITIAVLLCGLAACASSYTYLARNDDCNCEEYTYRDQRYGIDYTFRAQYRTEETIVTSIEIEFLNNAADTLHLDPGAVRMSSQNMDYSYNNRFIPLPPLAIPPGGKEVVYLTGRDQGKGVEWNKIAGESLTVTVKSLLLGEILLPPVSVVFIPTNPKLRIP